MERFARKAVLVALADELRKCGSWCGETHLQKAVYLLQGLTGVPLGFDFVLYKHGPFSFDLRDEIGSMVADGFLMVQPQPVPYGPSIIPGCLAGQLSIRFPQEFGPQVEFVAAELDGKKVVELEQLATALYVCLTGPAAPAPDQWAAQVNALKPHISLPEAHDAVLQVQALTKKAENLSRSPS